MEQPGGEIRRVVCFPPDGKLDTVAKILHVGEKGGVYYVNEKGKRIYLKKYQYKQLLEQHQLNGAVNIGTLDFDSISPKHSLATLDNPLAVPRLQREDAEDHAAASTGGVVAAAPLEHHPRDRPCSNNSNRPNIHRRP
ncbi:uncharacterized protein ACA1_324720 [Acanthamoeba castellanii str. Neff]|uniref:Uncharacterized protein n=1 Tax=Acanthamoeba castellanii (strain ATCC 30010 / Neff) TaxID=1257118 RepID=L8GHF0_ACACF|nr:uncharacterized protein ACA1_324720 [Acanthamoeba castellanii str. Neff]ELR12427.1 hypothetical protein ACA1_324720 [Acanthamoeba castellanii str. Neff]